MTHAPGGIIKEGGNNMSVNYTEYSKKTEEVVETETEESVSEED